ncbi:hypothetical protein N7E70_020135 [Aminobacter sp. NyZ550]|jgi:hypothetical protein|uniref:Uncharacterized protein n=3 Tax=Aminobacter TaxID=31988 RepID=A0AAC8YR81_AMIAI|nr:MULTISPECIES: hypothetical protein [Aminobacter]AMS42993.1 hypothetical protein AA2016_4076 [Aminobacter aminovorans]MBA8909469.1 hypothetical protein [Aminobacter ciceronei]MBA9023216.1 hypothetical protein [Aminobacter ciceronei]MBB3704844.1 hypothetical protein [Aminobacter aminovorans]MRX34312.1 hypothetical protein [Aminobacter sp. MDW-2]
MVLRLRRHAAALCVATAAVFAAMTMLEFLYFRSLSGGLPSLDLRFLGFSEAEGFAWIAAMGRPGAEIILVWHYLTFDLIFPALLSATLVSLMLKSGERLKRFSSLSETMRSVTALTLVLPYMISDYAQNIVVARILSDPASAGSRSMSLASALVVTKFAFLAVPVVVIAAFALAAKRNRSNSADVGSHRAG